MIQLIYCRSKKWSFVFYFNRLGIPTGRVPECFLKIGLDFSEKKIVCLFVFFLNNLGMPIGIFPESFVKIILDQGDIKVICLFVCLLFFHYFFLFNTCLGIYLYKQSRLYFYQQIFNLFLVNLYIFNDFFENLSYSGTQKIFMIFFFNIFLFHD